VEGKVAALRSALQSGSTDQIRSAMNELAMAAQKIGQAAYETPPATGPGAPEPGAEGEPGRSDDETVEGEFREV
jgi:molecular chaperone DnaK